MNESQLIKGILEGCVLAIIEEEETYGYEIIAKLDSYGFEHIIEGTLYPILSRLRKKGLIEGRSMKSPFGPIRKIYAITLEGSHALNDFKISYKKVTQKAEKILFEEEI